MADFEIKISADAGQAVSAGQQTSAAFVVQVAPGLWVFRATAVDADGIESDYSNPCRWGHRTGFRVRK